MSTYHAHVYYHPGQEPELLALLDQLSRSPSPLQLHRIHRHPVGPHALPMAELHFESSGQGPALDWLGSHRGPLSVLVHEDTGDDHRDHSEGAVWLGSALPIDFGFFDRVQERPELAIHPASRTK